MSLGTKSKTCVMILIVVVAIPSLTYYYGGVLAVGATNTIASQPRNAQQTTGTLDDWPTYHRDNSRSGYDPAFSPFTSASLSWTSATLDGDVYAEPLVVGTTGGPVVVVATEGDSLYELNAASGATIWGPTTLGTPVPASDLGPDCHGDIDPSGITSTPVIDVAGGNIFVVAFHLNATAPAGFNHELYSVDLATGNVNWNHDIDPQNPSNFPVSYQQQRAALALSNGYVYVGYGGLDGDCGPYHGWVAARDTNGLGPIVSYQVPTGREGAIWGGGDGPAVDSSGNILVATGNSAATTTFDFGDAVIKLSPATSTSPPPLSEIDYFAPHNWASLNSGDVDLGSTDPVILSPSYLFQIGKEGVGYILDATDLGHVATQDCDNLGTCPIPPPVYESNVCNGGGAYGGLAYSAPYLIVPCDNGLVTLNVNLATPSFTVAWTGPSYTTGPPIIAGNAVWDVDTDTGVLNAFSLTNGDLLFSDSIGSVPTHFNSLSAAYGQIFVAASEQVLAFQPTSSTIYSTVLASSTATSSTSTTSFSTVISSTGNTISEPPVTDTQTTTTFTSGAVAGTSTTTFTSPLVTSYSTTTTSSSSSSTVTQTIVATAGTITSETTTSTGTTLSTTVSAGTTTTTETDTFNVLVTTVFQELHQFSGELLQFLGFQVTATPVTQQVNQVIVTTTSAHGKVTMKVSYQVLGGGSPSAPVFHYVLNGASKSMTLTKTAKAVTMDAGSAWSVTPNPLTGSTTSQQWYSSQTLSGTASSATMVFSFQHQYWLTMKVSGAGKVTPGTGWNNAGAKVTITATPNSGHKFKSWKGTGTGSFTGTTNPATITMNSAITETATFT